MKNPTDAVEFFIFLKEFKKAKIVLDLLLPHAQTISELDQLGKLYYDIYDFNEAIKIGYIICDMVDDPQTKFDIRNNIINSYIKLNQPENALEVIELNERYNSKNYEVQLNKALSYFFLNKKDDSENILRNILKSCNDEEILNKVKFNLGVHELRKGNFRQGLHHFLLNGRKLNIWEEILFSKNQLWTGENQPEKTVVLCAEGGVGDEIISVRFMQHLRSVGIKSVWNTNRKDIADIFNRCGFETILNLKHLPEDWLWTYSMSVPYYLNLNEDDLWYGSYLKPTNRSQLLKGKKKIGIKTTGNPHYEQDLYRSIPFNELISCIPEDYTIYSFHVDEDVDHPRVIPLKNEIKSWDNTLDFIDQMDVIVSSCTSLIHAAGAMGKDSIVLVPILTYYVWAKPGYTSKWYGNNLTILRQTDYDNWDTPLLELKGML